MIITRQQMADWKKSGSKLSVGRWVDEQDGIVDVEVISKPRLDRKAIMADLDSRGIEYKKNAKTADLNKLLEE